MNREQGSAPTYTTNCSAPQQPTDQPTAGMTLSAAGMIQTGRQAQDHTDEQMNRHNTSIPAPLPGVRCYVDLSTTPDHPTLTPRKAGLGILFVNTQVQPAQTIYIKAQMSAAHSVIMAEAAALALAAMINDALDFNNTAFLSDCPLFVDFLNQNDQTHCPDWRIKSFTQLFTNSLSHRQAKVIKIKRNLNTTADSLARQASFASGSILPPVCSSEQHIHQCPLLLALNSVILQDVTILLASCC